MEKYLQDFSYVIILNMLYIHKVALYENTSREWGKLWLIQSSISMSSIWFKPLRSLRSFWITVRRLSTRLTDAVKTTIQKSKGFIFGSENHTISILINWSIFHITFTFESSKLCDFMKQKHILQTNLCR